MSNVFDGSLGATLFWIGGIMFVLLITVVTTYLLVRALREPTDSEWDAEKDWRRMGR